MLRRTGAPAGQESEKGRGPQAWWQHCMGRRLRWRECLGCLHSLPFSQRLPRPPLSLSSSRWNTGQGQPSPHPSLTGPGSQHSPPMKAGQERPDSSPGPWGPWVSGAKALGQGRKQWVWGRSTSLEGGGLIVTSAGTPIYAQLALRTLSAREGCPKGCEA